MTPVRSLSRLALAMAFAVGAATPLVAQGNNPIVFLPENGAGTIQFPGAPTIPLPGVLAPDPGPGGLALALTYDLLGPPSLVAGDLLLIDETGGISDVIRFNPAGTAVGYPASVVFYSLLESVGGELADVGFPTSFYANIVRMAEGPLGVVYTPTVNQPGYVAGFSATYRIESLSTVPEPATVVLLATGLVGIAGAARMNRRRRRSS